MLNNESVDVIFPGKRRRRLGFLRGDAIFCGNVGQFRVTREGTFPIPCQNAVEPETTSKTPRTNPKSRNQFFLHVFGFSPRFWFSPFFSTRSCVSDPLRSFQVGSGPFRFLSEKNFQRNSKRSSVQHAPRSLAESVPGARRRRVCARATVEIPRRDRISDLRHPDPWLRSSMRGGTSA